MATPYTSALTVTTHRHARKGRVFYQGRLMVTTDSGPRLAWQCDHHDHADREEAEDCAAACLKCDAGSLMAEMLQSAVDRAIG